MKVMTDNREAGDKRGAAIAAALLLAALAAIFRAELFQGADLFFKAYRDINPMTVWYPWSRIELAAWHDGFFPLWNHYNLLGHPLLADYQSAVFSVALWPLVFLPLEKIAVPYLFARVLVAGAGMRIFLRRINLPAAAATFGGVCFGLTGYLVQYINDQHLVIDMLLPWLLLAAELLATRGRGRDLLFMASLSWLTLVGGQPGSALFTLAMAYGYGAYRSLLPGAEEAPSGPAAALSRFGAAGLFAALAALPQLLPFLEFIPRAWTFHTSNFGSETLLPEGAATLLAPGFLGPLGSAMASVPLVRVAPYVGTVPAALALARLIKPVSRPDLFFAAILAVSLGVLLGLPGFNLIPQLPGLGSLTFIKYLQPLAAASVSVLAASSLASLGREQGAGKRVAAAAGAIFMAALLARLVFGARYPSLVHAMNGALLSAWAQCLALALMALFAEAARGPAKASRQTRPRAIRYLVPCVTALAIADLAAASLSNRPFMYENMAEKSMAHVARAAGVPGLADGAVIAGPGNIPPPAHRSVASADVYLPNQNLLAAIDDPGGSDALIIKETADLLRQMAGQDDATFLAEFLRYHSVRLPPGAPPSDLTRAAGVSRRLSRRPLPRNRSAADLLKNCRATTKGPGHFFGLVARVGEDSRDALYAHPPWRLDCGGPGLAAPPDGATFGYSAALMDDVRGGPGDGAWFIARDGSGLRHARYIDPRAGAAERRWAPAEFTVGAGGFRLATLPFQSLDDDRALIGDPRLIFPEDASPGGASRGGAWRGDERPWPVSDVVDGIRVYVDKEAWPLAFVVRDGAGGPDSGPVLDIEGLSEPAGGGRAGHGAMIASEPAELSWRGHGRIEVRVSPGAGGTLYVAESYYPGWRARVGSEELRVRRAAGTFMSVRVPPGGGAIVMSYRPWSFRIGLWSFVAAAAGGIAALAVRVRRSSR